jgi:hypothetical protein
VEVGAANSVSSSAQAEDPVLRDFSRIHHRLWNTGSPAFAGDDSL